MKLRQKTSLCGRYVLKYKKDPYTSYEEVIDKETAVSYIARNFKCTHEGSIWSGNKTVEEIGDAWYYSSAYGIYSCGLLLPDGTCDKRYFRIGIHEVAAANVNVPFSIFDKNGTFNPPFPSIATRQLVFRR